MQQKNKGNALGISLILVVFILLCLITFGTLSYLLAKVDDNLSRSVAENTIAFYNADATAKDTLQEIDALLASTYAKAESEEDYFAALQAAFQAEQAISVAKVGDDIVLTSTTLVSQKETLVATLVVEYPATGPYYTVQAWVLQSNTSM